MASCSLVLVFLSSSVVVSVATTADYPDDKVPLPPATTGRPVRPQATQGNPRVRGACVGLGRDGPWGAWGARGWRG